MNEIAYLKREVKKLKKELSLLLDRVSRLERENSETSTGLFKNESSEETKEDTEWELRERDNHS